ncbi:reprolysin-like metallopeptidase [Streptomyces javensis]
MPRRALLISAACTSAVLAVGIPSPASAIDGPDTRRVQVVMVNFTDSSFKDPAKSKAALQKAYFGKADSLTSYYNEVSNGAATFKPAADGDEGVVGPIDLPIPGAGCDNDKIHSETQKALEQQGIGWDDFEHMSIVFPNDTAKCGYGGLGSVGGGNTWVPVSGDGGSADLTVLVHEFGHNFGYQHQMRYACTGIDLATCKDTQTTSHKTPMGGGTNVAGLSAPELIHAKWLSLKEAPKVTKSQTYRLRSLYGKGGGVRALDLPIGDDRLVVEMRSASGTLDKGLEGIHAYRVPQGHYDASSMVDITPKTDHWAGSDTPSGDALAAGKSLTDKAHKVEVRVLKSEGGEATVAVSLNGVPAPASARQDVAPQSEGAAPAASSDGKSDEDLAATGGDSGTTMSIAAGGVVFLALGGAFVIKSMRSRRRSASRHAR